ncbi:MAG: IS3 family transposase [Candidatus Acidiferrales bacterium]
MELVGRREEARWLWGKFLVSQRRVCGLMVLAESSYRYRSCRNDEELRQRLREAAREKPRWGYRRLQIVLDQNGEHVNHKRLYRVYREAGLMIRRKARKRLLRTGAPRPTLSGPNQEWALDFVHDAAESGRKFRALSVVDPYTRECLEAVKKIKIAIEFCDGSGTLAACLNPTMASCLASKLSIELRYS